MSKYYIYLVIEQKYGPMFREGAMASELFIK